MAVTNVGSSSYQGVLSILSPSSDEASKSNGSESASQKLIDIAKNASSSDDGGSQSGPITSDTISLSESAQNYLQSAASGSSASGGDTLGDIYDRLGSQMQYDFDIVAQQNPGFGQAFKNRTLNIQNTKDIPGLNFQDHHTVLGGGTGSSDTYSWNSSAIDQSNPNQLLLGDGQGNEYLVSW